MDSGFGRGGGGQLLRPKVGDIAEWSCASDPSYLQPLKDPGSFWVFNGQIYVSLRLCVQNAVPAQPCVGKLGISLVLLNFLHCNFRLWFKTS